MPSRGTTLMSLASWTLLFGPSGADDDAVRRGSSVPVLLPGWLGVGGSSAIPAV